MIDGLEADVSRSRSPTTSTRLPRKHRSCRPTGRRVCRITAARTPRRSCSCPQGKPEGNQGLGRPRERRRGSHHAESEDVGRRAPTTTWPPGDMPSVRTVTTKPRRRSSSPSCISTCRSSTAELALRRTRSFSAEIGDRAADVGERGVPGRERIREGCAGDGRPSVSILAEPPVTVVERQRQKAWNEKGRSRVPGVPVRPRRAEGSRRNTSIVPRALSTPIGRHGPLPEVEMFSIEEFGGWQKAQERHFNDGGIFDKISCRVSNQCGGQLQARERNAIVPRLA